MTLLTLNANSTEPTDYLERKAVKAVVVDGDGNTLTFGSYLLGGGIDEGEGDEEALHRELMEEAGIEVEIIRPLGKIIGYRDALKKKYDTNGYLCRYLKTVSTPTTIEQYEKEIDLIWDTPKETIKRFEEEILDLQNVNKNTFNGDEYQSRLYNRQMSLAFLKEAFK